MQFGQQRLAIGLVRFVARGLARSVSHPRRTLGRQRALGRQQPFQLAMAHDQPHHMRSRHLYEARTQRHIVTQVVDANRESFERERRRGRNHFWQRRFLRRSAQSENG